MAFTDGLYGMADLSFTQGTTYTEGWSGISLKEIMQAPEAAFGQIAHNIKNNWLQYAVGAAITGAGIKIVRKMLAPQINDVNRMIFTGKGAPLRGVGFKI